MFDIRVTGLDQLSQLPEIFPALKHIQFRLLRDSSGEIDMESSMREMEQAVDRKLQQFSHNPLAKQVGDWAKQQFRQQILKQASEARSRLHSPGFPISEFNFQHPKGGVK
jgi:Zn-dependent M16 (insulinase) family peptidase